MVRRSRSVKPDAAVICASSSICGQGRSGLTWSGVSGETPPQSSMPASRISRCWSPTRFGGAWTRAFGPRTSRVTAIVAARSSSSASGVSRIFVSGLARKFCTMTSWMPLYSRDTLRSAKIASARSARRLADADEDAGGERDVAAAGVLQDTQPDAGVLVRRAEVRAALLGEQPLGRRLEHHPHRRGDRLEPLEVLPAEHAGVEMRQQAGLLENADGHRPDVGEGVVIAVRVQPFARLLPAVLRPVAEREQGFLAAERRALPGDLEHLVRAEERAFQLPWDRRERAVAAAVPAQPGQRDEHLLRVRDDPRPSGRLQPGVPGARRIAEQRAQVSRLWRGAESSPLPGPVALPSRARASARRMAASLTPLLSVRSMLEALIYRTIWHA